MGGSAIDRNQRKFQRSLESLDEIQLFVDEFFGRRAIDANHVKTVTLAIEELFTNMVKYSVGVADIRIDLARDDGEIEVSLTDFDVEPFDLTKVPEIRVDQPLEERTPGGLGIHLIKKMMDRVEYEYVDRRSKTTFYKSLDQS